MSEPEAYQPIQGPSPALIRPAVHFDTSQGLVMPSNTSRITLRHPGYPAAKDFIGSSWCVNPDVVGWWGLPGHVVVWIAQILSGNRAGVFRRTNSISSPVVNVGWWNLQPGDYFWFPENWNRLENPYPLVASFDDWQFPHEKLPPEWQFPAPPPLLTQESTHVSRYREAVHQRDGVCRVSGWCDALEVAHLVPEPESCQR